MWYDLVVMVFHQECDCVQAERFPTALFAALASAMGDKDVDLQMLQAFTAIYLQYMVGLRGAEASKLESAMVVTATV